MSVARPLDLERALLDQRAGEAVPMEVRRDGQTAVLDFALAESPTATVATGLSPNGDAEKTWETLGLALSAEPRSTFQRRSTRYRGGMRVESVRPGSPAAEEGILPGDILVGMHKWETASEQDIEYIISRPSLAQMGKLKFYVLRGQNTLYGHLDVATKPSTAGEGASRR
jgi:serine protease Do